VVLPSRYEPFGIVALEAAAAGAPLVSSTAGGLGEVVVDGTTGLSFPPGDVAALADAVTAVLDDPGAAAQRAKAARSRLGAAFDWSSIAAGTAAVYAAPLPAERDRWAGEDPYGNVFGRAEGVAKPVSGVAGHHELLDGQRVVGDELRDQIVAVLFDGG